MPSKVEILFGRGDPSTATTTAGTGTEPDLSELPVSVDEISQAKRRFDELKATLELKSASARFDQLNQSLKEKGILPTGESQILNAGLESIPGLQDVGPDMRPSITQTPSRVKLSPEVQAKVEATWPDRPTDQMVEGGTVRSVPDSLMEGVFSPGALLDPTNLAIGGVTGGLVGGAKGVLKGTVAAAAGGWGPLFSGGKRVASSILNKTIESGGGVRQRVAQALDPRRFDITRGPTSVGFNRELMDFKGGLQTARNITAPGLEQEFKRYALGRDGKYDPALGKLLADIIDDPSRFKGMKLPGDIATGAARGRALLDSKWAELKDLNIVSGWLEDYFPHMIKELPYEAPEKFALLRGEMDRLFSTSGILTGKSFKYSRKHTFDEFKRIVRAVGLTPVEEAPYGIAKYMEMADVAVAKKRFVENLRQIPIDPSTTENMLLMPSNLVRGDTRYSPLPDNYLSRWFTIEKPIEGGKQLIHDKVDFSIYAPAKEALVNFLEPTYGSTGMEKLLKVIDEKWNARIKQGKTYNIIFQMGQALLQIMATQKTGPYGTVGTMIEGNRAFREFAKTGSSTLLKEASMAGLNLTVMDELNIKILRELERNPESRGVFKSAVSGWQQLLFKNFTAAPMVSIWRQYRDHFISKGWEPKEAARMAVRPAEEIMSLVAKESMSRYARIIGNNALFARQYAISYPRILRGAMHSTFVDPAFTTEEAKAISNVYKSMMAQGLFWTAIVPQILNYHITGHSSLDNEPGKVGKIATGKLYDKNGQPYIMYTDPIQWISDVGQILNPAEWRDLATSKLSPNVRAGFKFLTGVDMWSGQKVVDPSDMETTSTLLQRTWESLKEFMPTPMNPDLVPGGLKSGHTTPFVLRHILGIPTSSGKTDTDLNRRERGILKEFDVKKAGTRNKYRDGKISESTYETEINRIEEKKQTIRERFNLERERRDQYPRESR